MQNLGQDSKRNLGMKLFVDFENGKKKVDYHFKKLDFIQYFTLKIYKNYENLFVIDIIH